MFFFAGFLRTVPRELEEAAAVDGAGLIRTYWKIVFPLLRATSTPSTEMNTWSSKSPDRARLRAPGLPASSAVLAAALASAAAFSAAALASVAALSAARTVS